MASAFLSALGFATFSIGDSKLGYLGQAGATFTSAALIPRILDSVASSGTKLAGLQQCARLGGVALGAVTIVGYLCTSRKNDPALRRSPSKLAGWIIVASLVFEMLVNVLVLVDPTLFYSLLAPEFSRTEFSPVGSALESCTSALSSSSLIGMGFIAATLKPTRSAAVLSLYMHGTNLFANVLLVQDLQPHAKSVNGKALIDLIEPSHVYHGLFAALLAAAIVIARAPPALEKSKQE